MFSTASIALDYIVETAKREMARSMEIWGCLFQSVIPLLLIRHPAFLVVIASFLIRHRVFSKSVILSAAKDLSSPCIGLYIRLCSGATPCAFPCSAGLPWKGFQPPFSPGNADLRIGSSPRRT
jgi:hypothetical protein